MNVSILDGWWAEGFRGDNGWAIGDGGPAPSLEAQDKSDGEALYQLLEDEVVPRFYERGEDSLPHRWIETMKASIESIVPRFSAHRMVRDYVLEAYLPAAARR